MAGQGVIRAKDYPVVRSTDPDRARSGRPRTSGPANVEVNRSSARKVLLMSRILRACLVAGPALLVVGTVVTPATSAELGPYLATVREHALRAQVGGVLFTLGHLLLVPAVLELARRAPNGLARVAGAAAALGAVLFAGLGFTRLYEVAIATSLGADRAVEAVEAFNTAPAAGLLIMPGLLGTTLGTVLLLVGYWRARRVPGWVPAMVLAGFVGVSTGGDGTVIGVVGSVLLTAAFVRVALRGTEVRLGAPVPA